VAVPYKRGIRAGQSNAGLTGGSIPPSRNFPPLRYPCKVPAVQVKRPRTRLELIRDTVWPIMVITLIVLKLAGVITWSWWWVLSPLWGGLVLNVLAIGGLLSVAMSCPRGFTVTDGQADTPPDLDSC
jgi:hypothetical protein